MDDVISVSAGGNHTMAIRADNSLWAWGLNWVGELGDGTTEAQHSPIWIVDNVVIVSTKGSYTMAIQSDDSLWAWGANNFGQLGNGRSTPYRTRHVPNPDPTMIMENVATVSAGFRHTLAIRADGSLWAWGANDRGQLGDGTTEDRHSPVMVMERVLFP